MECVYEEDNRCVPPHSGVCEWFTSGAKVHKRSVGERRLHLSSGPCLLTLTGKQKQPGLTNQPIGPLCLWMCFPSGDAQANVGDEFLRQPFVSRGSVDRLIKRRKGTGLRGGGLVGVPSEGMECEHRRVPPSLQASAELGS